MLDFIGDLFSSIFDAFASIFEWLGSVLTDLFEFIMENPLLIIALGAAFLVAFPTIFPSLSAALSAFPSAVSALAAEWGWGAVALAGLIVASAIDPDAVSSVVSGIAEVAKEVVGGVAEVVGTGVGTGVSALFDALPAWLPILGLGLIVFALWPASSEKAREGSTYG